MSAPPKLQQAPGQQGGPVVLGASCGGAHTAFLLRAVVDAKEDYREDQVGRPAASHLCLQPAFNFSLSLIQPRCGMCRQVELAASVIESFFRGNHVRVLSDAVQARKRGGRADVSHSGAQRDAAASVIQAGWRLKAADMERARNDQLQQMRALRDSGEVNNWGTLNRRFDAARVGKAFAAAGMEAAGLTRASW